MAEVDVTRRLDQVRVRIAAACAAAGRPETSVRLVAITKRQPLERVVAACHCGQWELGENRIQEALPRQAELARRLGAAGLPVARVRWHFVGHLQSNKANKALDAFVLLHGIDSVRLAEKLSERALAIAAGAPQPILAEVNVTGETQKHGLPRDGAVEMIARLAELPGLELQGLMCMARFGDPEPRLRASFASLRTLAEQARSVCGLPLPELSMGMSDDFCAAIAEGATLVRIGSALFGPRIAVPG